MMTVDELMEMVRLARENHEPDLPDSPAAFPKLLRKPATSEGRWRRDRVVEAAKSVQHPSP
jgi:hypothetical protein